MYMYVYTYTYIYLSLSLSMYIYIYIYTWSSVKLPSKNISDITVEQHFELARLRFLLFQVTTVVVDVFLEIHKPHYYINTKPTAGNIDIS